MNISVTPPARPDEREYAQPEAGGSFAFADDYGPARIVHICESSIGLRATLVQDSTALGPAIGGLSFSPAMSLAHCCRLARTMTLKSAAADVPHGGAKSVIFADPSALTPQRRQLLIRAFAAALRNEHDYIFAPDAGTDPESMAWIRDEQGRAVGLPKVLGGVQPDKVGATGWGLYHATEVALRFRDFRLDDARVVVQGFGVVGRHVAKFLAEHGAVVVAVADSRGAIHNPHGLDVGTLIELKSSGRSVAEFGKGERLERDALIELACDIWIPAAGADALNRENVGRLRARLVVEGADVAVTDEAAHHLHERGILCVPDFIGNAGGLISAALEYRGATQSGVMPVIKERVRRNTERVLAAAEGRGVRPRDAALRLATDRVRTAMSFRRWNSVSGERDAV